MPMFFSSFYDLLGVPVEASIDDINTAYKKQVQLWQSHHKIPDNDTTILGGEAGVDNTRLMWIEQAHRVLSDDRMRRLYDRYLLENSSRHIPFMQLKFMRKTFSNSKYNTKSEPPNSKNRTPGGGSDAATQPSVPSSPITRDDSAHASVEQDGIAKDGLYSGRAGTVHHHDACDQRNMHVDPKTQTRYAYWSSPDKTRRSFVAYYDSDNDPSLKRGSGKEGLPRRVQVFEQQLMAGHPIHGVRKSSRPSNGFDDSALVVDANMSQT